MSCNNLSDVYLEPNKKSARKLFVKIVNKYNL